MRLSHDDQMRQVKARVTSAVGRVDALSAADRTERRQMSLTPRPQQQVRIVNARGAMKTFLAQARTIQNLPSFAKRMRE